MAAKTDIYNLALSHLAAGREVGSLTETSAEVAACNRFYQPSVQATLRDFPAWPFAQRIAALPLVVDYTRVSAQPNVVGPEWGYAYRYPPDCMRLKRILSGMRRDIAASRVPYRVIGDSQGQLVLTDMINAQTEYTAFVDVPDSYPPDFVLAVSLRLAVYIAPRLTAGDAYKLGANAWQLYQAELAQARANAANEEQPDQDPPGELILARY